MRPNQVSSHIYAASMMGIIRWWLAEGQEYGSHQIAAQTRLLHKR
ncbi:hypothetical protein [Gracilibacillus sp. Marseille-QA3620]